MTEKIIFVVVYRYWDTTEIKSAWTTRKKAEKEVERLGIRDYEVEAIVLS